MATNVIVDLSHHNDVIDFERAEASGIRGVIHKATQGRGFTDQRYRTRQTAAKSANLLWGAYHFGDGSDGVAQAEFFLNSVGDAQGILHVLDFERNSNGPSMTLNEARAFVTHIKDVTGRWPGFYCGHYYKELLGSDTDPVIANCWLWLAQYGPTPISPPTWREWTMWQYTDASAGSEPHEVPGIGRCDRDLFRGTQQQLTEFWSAEGSHSANVQRDRALEDDHAPTHANSAA